MNRSLWPRIAALAVLCLLPLSACQARAGAAAFVGNTRISDNRVQDLTAKGLRDPVVGKGVKDVAAYRGVVLSRLIKHEIIAGVAKKARTSISDGDVAKAISDQQTGAGGAEKLVEFAGAQPYGIPQSQFEAFFGDLALLNKIGLELTKNVVISDADLKAFYDQNDGASGGTFEELKPRVLAAVQARIAGQALLKYITEYLRGVRVKVNPLYGKFDSAKFFDNSGATLLKPAPDDFFIAPPSAPSSAPPSAPPQR